MYLRIESAPAGLQSVKLGSVIFDVCPDGRRPVFAWMILDGCCTGKLWTVAGWQLYYAFILV